MSSSRRRTAARERALRARAFFERDIWREDLSSLPQRKASLYGFLRMLHITATRVFRDKLPLRAAALTFTTLLSIVPVLAIGLSLAKAMGFKTRLEAAIHARIPPAWPQELKDTVAGIFTQVDATSFKTLGTIGLVLLFFAAIRVLSTIEQTFNDIWGVRQSRTFARRVSDFVSALVIMPVLMLAATSANAFLASETVLSLFSRWAGPLVWIYLTLLQIVPFALLWIAFTGIYAFMPNTSVRITSALVGGIVAGTAWQVLQWLSIQFGVGISRYNAIYGTFAALPIFLAWLQASWVVVLFGAEVTFAHQNYRTYQQESDSPEASFSLKERLGLEVARLCARSFLEGEGPWDPAPFAARAKAPIRLVREIVNVLVEGNVLARADGGPERCLPARDPRAIGTWEILKVLRERGEPIDAAISTETQKLADDLAGHDAKFLAGKTLAALAGAKEEK